MTAADALHDAPFRETAADVVVRRLEHGQYRGARGAAEALRRRAPGYPADVYDDALARLFALYDDTVRTVRASPLCSLSPSDGDAYAQAWAETAEALASQHPDLTGPALPSTFLNWVHYWYCLR